jgi:hypothetical protein
MKYKLFADAKLWTLVGDLVFGGLALGLTFISDPVAFAVATYVVGGLQPIVFLVIAELFVADAQTFKLRALDSEVPLPAHFK